MIYDVYDVFHLCDGVVGTQYGATEGNACDACLKDGWDVGLGDATYSHNGNIYPCFAHLVDDAAIAFQSQNGSQFLLVVVKRKGPHPI